MLKASKCLFLLILSIFILSGAKARSSDTENQDYPNRFSPVGINLSSVSYWSTELPFKDIFKHSQPWVSQQAGKSYGKGRPLSLTHDGWIKWLLPGQSADTLMCRGDGNYHTGKYLLFYHGHGQMGLLFDAVEPVDSGGLIRFNIDLTSSDGFSLVINRIDDQLPVSSIKIVHSDFQNDFEKLPFRPGFIDRWSKFKVIRFMDWMQTNNSRISHWQDRPTVNMQTQGSKKGVALEYMIELANTLHADPWFCMPHLSDDDYIAQFADMVSRKLDPDLKVYVEYTNEAWNSMFDQNTHCMQMGTGMGLNKDPYLAGLYYYAKRSMLIFDIWRSQFKAAGYDDSTNRVVRVLSAQFSNPWTSQQILGYENARFKADALAVAPYFGSHLGTPTPGRSKAGKADKKGKSKRCSPFETTSMSLEQILDACEADIDQNHSTILEHAALTAASKLDLIAYEGGQHLVGSKGLENDKTLTWLFHRANRDQRMQDLYLKDLNSWKRAGGKLFVTFSSMGKYNKWGSWGLLEHPMQDSRKVPKYRAVMKYIDQQNDYKKPIID